MVDIRPGSHQLTVDHQGPRADGPGPPFFLFQVPAGHVLPSGRRRLKLGV